jgi:hypothetical protein
MNARQLFAHPEVEWAMKANERRIRSAELVKERELSGELDDVFQRAWNGEPVMLPRVSGVPGKVLWDVPFLDAMRDLVVNGDDQYIDMLLTAELAPADKKEAIRENFRAESFRRWMNFYGDDVARVLAAEEVAADEYNAAGDRFEQARADAAVWGAR